MYDKNNFRKLVMTFPLKQIYFVLKKDKYQLINFIPFIIYMMNGMFLKNDLLSRTGTLFRNQ